MFRSEIVLVWTRDEIFVDSRQEKIPGIFRLGREARLAGKKFLWRCPCKASVYG